MIRALITLAAAVLLSSAAIAAAPAPPLDPAQAIASCRGLVEGKLCDLPDQSGGICAWIGCAEDPRGGCLGCVPSTTESQTSDLWKPMLAFGATVTLVGGVFWFRMKRNWNLGK